MTVKGYAGLQVDGRDIVGCWTFLREHPKLQWVPPAWRRGGGFFERQVALRAIERNLIVTVEQTMTGPCFKLVTGPLKDLVSHGEVDPFTPVMVTDDRLAGCGATFDEAVVSLAEAVVEVYGSGVLAEVAGSKTD